MWIEKKGVTLIVAFYFMKRRLKKGLNGKLAGKKPILSKANKIALLGKPYLILNLSNLFGFRNCSGSITLKKYYLFEKRFYFEGAKSV